MVLMKQQKEKEGGRIVEPLVNIYEEGENIILEAEMPGLSRDEISLELKAERLILTGKKRQLEDSPKGYSIIYRERCPLEYLRTFIIGDEIDREKITAQYEGGILRVKLAKSEQNQPKKIDIR
ncbi:MAG TPA: Hsp20/alpha crystallin family protein [Candidatus Omnitrophica bacterium]|nr:Hsp20/alpha crystallin family protein [Candidatus Omnitrophota bacterium]